MGKKIVIALGGNALGKNLEEQYAAARITAKTIVDLIEAGNDVVVSHGNGPQVGFINSAISQFTGEPFPMTMSGAMSQAYIGYDLQNVLREELLDRGIKRPVATIVTQVVVDSADPAFQHPTKPIGRFMTAEEAEVARNKGETVMEDAGRGYRVVVPSPKPVEIVEIDSIHTLVDSGHIVIACGGGGIPVVKSGKNHLKGVNAVIDKDFASCTLAQQMNADCLIILTAVEKVAIHFGKENQTNLDTITPEQAAEYISQGEFAPGSMLPKVEAAVQFVRSKEGRYSIITLLEKAKEAIQGKTGTIIR